MRGYLKKRTATSWTVVVELPHDPATDKRRQQWVSVKGTKRDAEKRLAELIAQVDKGGFVKPTKLTVGDFLRRWMADYATTNVRPRTLQSYKSIVEGQLIPGLGAIALTALEPAHLQAFYAKRMTEGRTGTRPGPLAARTVLHYHRVLSEALSHAVKWGLASRNVAEAVDPPKPAPHELRVLDGAGVHTVLSAAQSSRFYPIIHLAVYTGMRRSEILGLRWCDVDLDMATISVVQVLHRLPGTKEHPAPRMIFDVPKSAKGKRQVALSPAAVLGLRAHREREEAKRAMLEKPLTDHDLVFAHPDGRPLFPDSITHAFNRIAAKAGYPGVRFHDLRHSHASILLRQGTHPKVVQERLGHATIAVTLDTYSHVTPGLQEAAARGFDEELERERPANRPLATPEPPR